VEVRTGVESGEQVVVGGQERLAEGAPVQPKVIDRTRPASPEVDAVGAAGKDTAS